MGRNRTPISATAPAAITELVEASFDLLTAIPEEANVL
jgi:hypothetical protein